METAPPAADRLTEPADRLTQRRKALVAVGGTFGVAAAAVIAVAALTTWWVLLALIPLLMMIGCMVMMAAMPWGGGWGPWGCAAGMLRDESLARPHYRSQAFAEPRGGKGTSHH